MKKSIYTLGLIFIILFFSGFFSQKTAQDQRAEIVQIRNETMDLLKENIEVQLLLNRAYGYAVFSDVGVNLISFSNDGGYGIAHNNLNGENIYMKMEFENSGVEADLKDFRALFIFETKKAFDNFVQKGWQIDEQQNPNVKLFKITKKGVALQTKIQGTKYSKDKVLNQ